MKHFEKIFTILIILAPVINIFSQVPDDFYIKKNFDTKKTIAKIDTIKITAEEFFLNYEFGPAFTKKLTDAKSKHLEYMIDEKLLALEGYSNRKDTTEEVRSMVDEFTGDIAAEQMFKKEILPKVKVNEEVLNRIIEKKQTEVELKWLFTSNENEMKGYIKALSTGANFDSLFNLQVKDSLNKDDRSMKTSMFSLEKSNPQLAAIVDTLQAGKYSVPFHVPDGWYIVKLDNIRSNIITTQSENEKLKQEAENAAMKVSMDSLSDAYVKQLVAGKSPVIKKYAYSMIRSYLGKMVLDKEKYISWQLEDKLNEALKNLGANPGKSVLVEMSDGNYTVDDFLYWYRNRSLYIKMTDKDFNSYSAALEQLIWRMVRDRLIAADANKKGYYKNPEVLKQADWWKDKIVGSAVRNDILNSAMLTAGEVTGKKADEEKLEMEFSKKMLHKILALKQKYKITINKEELGKIPVSDEDDKRAIEFYMVKTGGLIPRNPYPSINNEWASWQ
jgi:hypothetical protein